MSFRTSYHIVYTSTLQRILFQVKCKHSFRAQIIVPFCLRNMELYKRYIAFFVLSTFDWHNLRGQVIMNGTCCIKMVFYIYHICVSS